MTNPITFTALPFPDLDDDADSVAAQKGISNVSGQNFSLINPYFTGHRTRVVSATSYLPTGLYNLKPNDYTWRAFTATQFPPLSLTLPKNVAFLMATIAAEVAGNANDTELQISYLLQGEGKPDGNTRSRTAVISRAVLCYAARTTVFIPGNPADGTIVGGKLVTMTPQWRLGGNGGNSLTEASIQLTAFYGDPL